MSDIRIRLARPGDEAPIADLLTRTMESAIIKLNANPSTADHLRSDVSFLGYQSAKRWIAAEAAFVAEVYIKRFPTIVGVGSLALLDPERRVSKEEVAATGMCIFLSTSGPALIRLITERLAILGCAPIFEALQGVRLRSVLLHLCGLEIEHAVAAQQTRNIKFT